MTKLPRREANRLARQTAILDAALALFSSRGFSGASMEAIAEAAGVSKPTLYQYFPNKLALFDAMMLSKRDVMMLAFDAQDSQDMVPQLVAFARAYAQTVMRPDMLSLARLIIGEAQRFPQIGRAYQAAGPDRLLDGMKAYLVSQKSAGRLQFDDAGMAAEDLWGLVLSAPRNRALYDPLVQISVEEIARFVFNGLAVFLRAYSTDVQRDLDRLEEERRR